MGETTVEWLPSGAESGLLRVRGRWNGVEPAGELPALLLRADGLEHRFDSLPDARFGRDAASWRGTYLVPAESLAKVQGQPFKISELEEKIRQVLES